MIKNLIKITNESSTLELLGTLKEGKKISVSVRHTDKEKELVWQDQGIFVFDVCRAGNVEYNVVSVIRDLLNKHYAPHHWTRGKVKPLIGFEPYRMQGC